VSEGKPASAATDLVAELSARLDAGGLPELDPVELAAEGRSGWTEDALRAALETLADQGRVVLGERSICPNLTCRRPLAPADVEAKHCPSCDTDFRATGDEPAVRTVYRYAGPLSRDLEWAIVIHGMNTLGPWQEELSWRLSNQYRYSAPVLIYKYGIVRLGALFRFRHRALVRVLGERIRRGIEWAAKYDRHRPPDIILHSFGTLMFAKLLALPDFADLRFGRVILAGSIVRPDHLWASHLSSGRVEAILNHCGASDRTVELAAFAIPDTGPSGRVGFRDQAVLSVRADGYDHSTFFQDRGLTESLADEGLWEQFLRVPLGPLEDRRMDVVAAERWRRLPLPLRGAALWLLPLVGVGALALLRLSLLWICPFLA